MGRSSEWIREARAIDRILADSPNIDKSLRVERAEFQGRWNAVIEALEISGIDAAPWLLRLARDRDAEVRLTAITLLATTGDRALLEEVRRIAQADSDPRIRDQLERLEAPQLGRSPAGGSSPPAMR